MGIKSKVFGIVAAAALTLSMVASVGANTVNTPASVTLRGTGCTVSVSKSSFHFGVWDYDGTDYIVHPNHVNNTSHPVTWEFKAGNPAGCDATLTFAGLSNTDPNYASHKIGPSYFEGTMSMYFHYTGDTVGPIGPVALDNPLLDLANGFSNSNPFVAGVLAGQNPLGLGKFPTSTINGSIELTSVPQNIMPGEYTGTVISTVTNGQ